MVSFSEAVRTASYCLAAVSSTWVAFLFYNDRRYWLAAFFVSNALMNLAWLVALMLAVFVPYVVAWRTYAITPLVVINAVLLTVAMIVRVRRTKNGKVYFTDIEVEKLVKVETIMPGGGGAG